MLGSPRTSDNFVLLNGEQLEDISYMSFMTYLEFNAKKPDSYWNYRKETSGIFKIYQGDDDSTTLQINSNTLVLQIRIFETLDSFERYLNMFNSLFIARIQLPDDFRSFS